MNQTIGERILVVEDEEPVRDRVLRILREQGFQVADALERRDIFAMVDGGLCAALVLDLGLPGDDGISIAKAVRERSDVPILILTGKAGIHSRVNGLEAGADDYLVKPFAPEELVARLRALLRRARRPAAPAATAIAVKIGTAHLDLLSGELSGPGGQARLTEREAGLLLALARSGSPLSREATYRQVFQREWDPADRSLDVHIAHLRRKLESACGETGVIATVRGKGYELRLPANVVTLPANPT